jgi:hypothetical protein
MTIETHFDRPVRGQNWRAPVIGTWTTTQLAQSVIVKATAGAAYYCDWGDGTVETFAANGAEQTRLHTYGAAGTYRQTWMIADPTTLRTFYCYDNLYSGGIYNLAQFTSLQYLSFNTNLFTGSLPLLPHNMAQFGCAFNGLSGAIPCLTNNAHLLAAMFQGNAVTDYTASVIAPSCTVFYAEVNLLPQSAIDQILADFAAGIAGRPAVGIIDISGAGNAAPSAAGLASKATILGTWPLWTVTNN